MIAFRGDPKLKEVALIFDDGPNPKITPQLLQVLKDKQVSANFFLIGARAEEYPDVARQIVDEGHEIGNHTYTHKRLVEVLVEQGEAAVRDEIEKGHQAIQKITGQASAFLRPPYLSWSDEVATVAAPLYGDKIMMAGLAIGDYDWSVNGNWQEQDEAAIAEQAKKIIDAWQEVTMNGTLLSFHDSSEHNLPGNKQREFWQNRALPTLRAMPAIIDYLHEQGFTIKKLSDMHLIYEPTRPGNYIATTKGTA